MNRRPLGTSGVSVTELGFGAAAIGNLYSAVDEDTALAAVDAAWHHGIRYFDTAPHYGLGLSERRLGTALAGRPRDDYVLSTKVGRLLVPNPNPVGTDIAAGFDVPDDLTRQRDYTREGTLRSVAASLQRMRTDRIDIALVHDPDTPEQLDRAISQAIPALVDLRRQGVLRAVGAGMNDPRPLQRIVTDTDVDVVMIAGRWTLLDRSARPLLDACRRRGVAVLAAAPFNSGLLARPWPPDGATYDYQAASPELLDSARAMARACDDGGVPLPAAALQFALREPTVVAVVAGMRTPAEAGADADWCNAAIGSDLWRRLDGLAAAG